MATYTSGPSAHPSRADTPKQAFEEDMTDEEPGHKTGTLYLTPEL